MSEEIKEKMKILFTQETDWLKRNPIVQHHLAEMLSLRGHEIRVIDYEILWRTQGKNELHSKREVFTDVCKIYQDAKVTLIRPSIVKVRWVDYVSLVFSHKREIERQIKESPPHVVIGFDILNAYLLMKAAQHHNLPFIYYWTDVNHLLIPFKPFQPIGKMVESRTLKRADRILVVSDKLKDYVARIGASPDRTQVLKPGISLERFTPTISGSMVRKQYGFEENDVVLFFMGWLYKFSGLREIISGLAQTKIHNLKLLIVGEGDAYDELQKLKDRHNLQGKVILTGQRPYQEMPKFIAASDICLLPAYPTEKVMQDGFPAKMFEYMAMKKPVISTKLPAILGEFKQDNGVVYVDQAQQVIAKAMELVRDGTLEELGLKARGFVEKYSWNSIADKFENILQEVISEKRQAKCAGT